MLAAVQGYGITGRAFKNGLVRMESFNPRTFTDDRHQTVDDRPYGGGPGMVMRVQPLLLAVEAAKKWLRGLHQDPDLGAGSEPLVVYLSPQGKRLNQEGVTGLANHSSIVLIAGRYEGVDERFVESEVDVECSIGDYVLSGGELPAMVVIDALIRRLPGALGASESAEQDSFVSGLLDCPHYTRPEKIGQKLVPEVLLSGDHKRIAEWRLSQSLGRTWERRPDLLENIQLDQEQAALLEKYKTGGKP